LGRGKGFSVQSPTGSDNDNAAELAPTPHGAAAVPPLPVKPLEMDESEASIAAQAAQAAQAARRFCTVCGGVWDAVRAVCPDCEARQKMPAPIAPLPPMGRPVGSALALYFTLLGTILIGAVIILVGGSSIGAIDVEIAIGILDALIVIGWCAASPREILPLLGNPAAPRWYAVALGAVPVTFLLATLTVGFLVKFCGLPQVEYVRPVFEAGYGWPTIVLLTCVQPAIFEELAFRGVILGGMRQVLDDREAIVVAAMLFMIIHLSLLSFPHLVLIGLVLGYVRVKSGSLYPGMLAHFGHNLAVVLTERWLS
jgi:membrane protease YdiL (CAAX protease family)